MSLLEKIKDYLASHPWSDAREIAKALGLKRKEVNQLLYAHSDLFAHDDDKNWAVALDSIMAGLEAQTRNVRIVELEVEGIDLIHSIKELLKRSPGMTGREIAATLDIEKSEANRALHAYGELFTKSEKATWSISPDYTDSTTGSGAEFKVVEGTAARPAGLPAVDYRESGNAAQEAVIEAALERNILVLAAPGTGKTHTLIERLVAKITKALVPVDAGQLLVLSFTRAAVGEIRTRIAKAIDEGATSKLRYVRVMTFDAYATWLLTDGEYDLSKLGFDKRIELLASEVAANRLQQATERISRSKYLFVDEIQDLTGVRAEMVFELLKRVLSVNGSVTMLGDPLQSLFEYQAKGGKIGSAEFITNVKHLLAGGLDEYELVESRRYETAEMKNLALNAKGILESRELEPLEKFQAIVEIVPKIEKDDLEAEFTRGEFDAVLCRGNNEVNQWYNWVSDLGLSARVNAGSDGPHWPGWLGAAMLGFRGKSISLDNFVRRALEFEGTIFEVAREDVERFVVNENLVQRGRIDLRDLSFLVDTRSPLGKYKVDAKEIVISNVHKAKGLEYGRVMIVSPKFKVMSEEEVRVLYVAVTRAKNSVRLLSRGALPFGTKIEIMKKSRKDRRKALEKGSKKIEIIDADDLARESFFHGDNGVLSVDYAVDFIASLMTGQPEYFVAPIKHNGENDHIYALWYRVGGRASPICCVDDDLKQCLDSMSFGNGFHESGSMLNIGLPAAYETIVHPLNSPALDRAIGSAGLIPVPIIAGFHEFREATTEFSSDA